MDLYAQCLEEEKKYVFKSVTHEDLLQLGLTLIETNKEQKGPLAIRIILNGAEVFSYYPDGTGKYNKLWMRKKANMVTMREMSSLRAYLELERNKEDMEKDWGLNSQDYVACGGGFPIRLECGSVVGAVCVSGLPHFDDHAALIKGIQKYFETK